MIVITAACPVGALIGMAFLKEESGWVHLWLGIVPAGFGFASVVTSTLSEYLYFSQPLLLLSEVRALILPLCLRSRSSLVVASK